MSKKPESLGMGDWIVHSYYGIGQIESIVSKIIENTKARYFRVVTTNSTFFVPVNKLINDRIRPISSEYKLRLAKKLLQSPPEALPENHNDRKKLILETISDNSLTTTAQMIRDLHNRKHLDGLTDFEAKILQNIRELFVREWSIILKISEDSALEQLEKLLSEPLPLTD